MRKTITLTILSGGVAGLLALAGCSKEQQEKATTAKVNSPNTELIAAATGVCNYDLHDSTLIAQGYQKVFEENFSTNLNKWDVWNSGAYNNELQCYKPANLQLTNGILVITAKKETVTGYTDPDDHTTKTFQYTSGRVECKTNFSASSATPKVRFAARIKLAAGYGMWPAFWTYGGNWPTQGEIDILESQGQHPFVYTTDYWYGATPGEAEPITAEAGATITSDVDLTTCYHVYEVIWEKNSLTFLLDGKVVNVKRTADRGGKFIPSMFGKLQHVTLNAALGADNFGDDFDPSKIKTGTTYVDWVKVYTAK
jgi:beta-glucanase (GH16 family)